MVCEKEAIRILLVEHNTERKQWINGKLKHPSEIDRPSEDELWNRHFKVHPRILNYIWLGSEKNWNPSHCHWINFAMILFFIIGDKEVDVNDYVVSDKTGVNWSHEEERKEVHMQSVELPIFKTCLSFYI